MKYFTVLSFNTWKCEGDYLARLESMVTEITLIERTVKDFIRLYKFIVLQNHDRT